ncbi:MAG: oxidase [Gammaproteobacteria bacterium]|nr:oxidase [Gammaproteobacteria bacterium]
MDRRTFVRGVTGGLALAGTQLLLPRSLWAGLPDGTIASEEMFALPGKQPLIKRSFRPPNFETPVSQFTDVITPNDRFFVRWHLASIPEIDPREWKLGIGGDAVTAPFEVTLEQLQRDFEQVEIVAVCQCSGNRRGLSDPHVPGVQWGYGAMGNARWKGVRLKDLLAKAGIGKDAVELALDGADRGALDATPDFIKSIPVWKAMDENTIVAWQMNGEPLPHWNGAPARLIVPGWTATYWTKKIVSIRAVTQPVASFWMAKAYRVPKGKFPSVDRFTSQETAENTPITEIVVNSLVTNVSEGQKVRAGAPLVVKGMAWDAGYGIRSVDVSTDGGRSWQDAELGADLGRFSFRPWQFVFKPSKGAHTISARASNGAGQTQVEQLIFNPAGYNNNVIQRIGIEAV